MPIYEYECAACGEISEFIEGLSGGGGERVCRRCGSASLSRVLSKGVTSRLEGMIGARGGKTCCGRQERCDAPPCSEPGSCCR